MTTSQSVLNYEQPVLLLGRVEVPLPQLHRELSRGLPLIAVDGGANQLLGSDIMPDAIVGDLDSLQHRENWAKHSKLIPIAEQDTTDFEKCLYSVRAPSYIALGFSGRRLDHTLANLHVMAKRVHSHRLVLVGEHDVVVVCEGDVTIELPRGLRVSLFPLTPVVFERSAGLSYPLNGLRLAAGEMVGTSNSVSSENVQIIKAKADRGLYALMLPLEAQAAVEAWNLTRAV